MSDVDQLHEQALRDAAFSRASGRGFLEACRQYVEHRRIADNELPGFYRRLGEALLHKGRNEDAVECARLAFDLQPEKEEIANSCAWVFSNSGRHEEAALAYERLLELRPQWVEGHRHASGSFAAAGQMDRAIFHAEAASGGRRTYCLYGSSHRTWSGDSCGSARGAKAASLACGSRSRS